jgi:hypothetical protein
MEPEVSLPCSQEPTTSSYPELDESTPYHPVLFLYDPYNIVTCIPIARQRLGKHIPATNVHSKIGCPLLGNGVVNTVFSLGPFLGVIKG